jgi:hypothetical protein
MSRPTGQLSTAKAQRTPSLIFFLFSFDPAGKKRDFQDQENKKHKPFVNMILFLINRFSLHSHFFDILPQRISFSFLPSQQKRKHFFLCEPPPGRRPHGPEAAS